ncbi:hypothetical protein [Tateyamaria omphalii]|uniref:Uncharacterized protein n=1 Tax=Tateyamaria omphalii TaxID=299262 RepID=A0A1P8MXZ2_9RHOB|nr:hypothetical protein [Tateyamaria omphalii]APX12852.1 hypothetical protein BWR18_15010 [Tateyamaria omphalii]
MAFSLATFLVVVIVPFWAPTFVKAVRGPIANAGLRFGVGALAVTAALFPIQIAFFPMGPITRLPMDLGFFWLGTAPYWASLLIIRIAQLGLREREQNDRKAQL